MPLVSSLRPIAPTDDFSLQHHEKHVPTFFLLLICLSMLSPASRAVIILFFLYHDARLPSLDSINYPPKRKLQYTLTYNESNIIPID